LRLPSPTNQMKSSPRSSLVTSSPVPLPWTVQQPRSSSRHAPCGADVPVLPPKPAPFTMFCSHLCGRPLPRPPSPASTAVVAWATPESCPPCLSLLRPSSPRPAFDPCRKSASPASPTMRLPCPTNQMRSFPRSSCTTAWSLPLTCSLQQPRSPADHHPLCLEVPPSHPRAAPPPPSPLAPTPPARPQPLCPSAALAAVVACPTPKGRGGSLSPVCTSLSLGACFHTAKRPLSSTLPNATADLNKPGIASIFTGIVAVRG
jgi:hypothetical protein